MLLAKSVMGALMGSTAPPPVYIEIMVNRAIRHVAIGLHPGYMGAIRAIRHIVVAPAATDMFLTGAVRHIIIEA